MALRGWAGPATLDLLTDARSGKPAELAHQPAVELCWLLPRARSQFRLRGALQTLEPWRMQLERERNWRQLTSAARALWGWPQPGAPFDPQASFPSELADGTPVPGSFAQLRLAISQVELLELTAAPHRRRRWCADQQWAEQLLNP